MKGRKIITVITLSLVMMTAFTLPAAADHEDSDNNPFASDIRDPSVGDMVHDFNAIGGNTEAGDRIEDSTYKLEEASQVATEDALDRFGEEAVACGLGGYAGSSGGLAGAAAGCAAGIVS